jgi:FdhD protein
MSSEREDTQKVHVVRHPQGAKTDDVVAVEEPMEIRVNDTPVAVLMRTPGLERELVAGFLLTEGIIDDFDDIQAIAHCTEPTLPNRENIMLISLAAGCSLADQRIKRAQRQLYTSSSCGLCGKATIDNLFQHIVPNDTFCEVPRSLVNEAGTFAREKQPVFQQTGGIHGAALFDMAEPYAIEASAEDIGRHNAVDKCIGAMVLADKLPLSNRALWVSGRASFEIVQKALVAGISAMISVGAPSSLAVDLAQRGHLTLIGFARQTDHFNVYCGRVGRAS